jgi:hypothetical protein
LLALAAFSPAAVGPALAQQAQISGAYRLITINGSNSENSLVDDVTAVRAWVETGSKSDVILTQIHLDDGSNINISAIRNFVARPYPNNNKNGVRIYFEISDPMSNEKITDYRLAIGILQKDASSIGDPQKIAAK